MMPGRGVTAGDILLFVDTAMENPVGGPFGVIGLRAIVTVRVTGHACAMVSQIAMTVCEVTETVGSDEAGGAVVPHAYAEIDTRLRIRANSTATMANAPLTGWRMDSVQVDPNTMEDGAECGHSCRVNVKGAFGIFGATTTRKNLDIRTTERSTLKPSGRR